MQNRLLMCAAYLKEVQDKLAALHDSLGVDLSEKSKITEAILFIEQARKAVSESQSRVGSLKMPAEAD